MAEMLKESGNKIVGLIPGDKNTLRIKYFLSYQKGRLPRETNLDSCGKPYIGASDLDSNTDCKLYTADASLPDAKRDDLLVLWDGARAGISGTGREGKVSSTVVRIRPSNNQLTPRFLYYYYKGFESYFIEQVNGTTIPHMNKKYIEDIDVVDWTINEQKAIASFLDEKCAEIDKLSEDIQRQINILENDKKSMVYKILTNGSSDSSLTNTGDDVWKTIPKGWKLVDIKYLFEIVKRIAGKEGYDVLSVTQKGLKVKDITSGDGQLADDYSKYQLVFPSDYVMNHMDLLTGWVDLSDKTGVTSPDYRVFRLRDKRNNSLEYFKHVMQCCYMNKIFYSLGQGVSNLGRWRLQTSAFNNFKIPVPPLSEQQAIADKLTAVFYNMDKAINLKNNQLQKLDDYKKSIIYEYVTGKKRAA